MASSTLLIPAPAVGPCRLMTSTLVTVPLSPSSTGGPNKLQDIVVQIERIGAGAAVENVLREIIRRNVIEYVVAAAAEQDIGPGAAVEMVGERAAVDGLGAAVAHIGLQVEDLRVDVGGCTVVVGPGHERIAIGEGRDRRKPSGRPRSRC